MLFWRRCAESFELESTRSLIEAGADPSPRAVRGWVDGLQLTPEHHRGEGHWPPSCPDTVEHPHRTSDSPKLNYWWLVDQRPYRHEQANVFYLVCVSCAVFLQ